MRTARVFPRTKGVWSVNAFSVPRIALSGAFLCLALVTIPAGSARAADSCADVNTLVSQASSNFSNQTVGATNAGAPLMLPGAEECAVTRSLSGSKAYQCVWNFPYRAAEALNKFHEFNRLFQQCFGDRASVSRDQPVNHPDFYDQRRYQMDDAGVTISIKDKGALQRTYVFVRVRGERAD